MDKVHTRISRYQREAGREAHAGHGPRDRDLALLQRLAQRLARGPGELRQLVEEQHAVVGERDLAGSGDLAPADQAGDRDGVVGGAERADPDEAGAGAEEAGGGEHLGDLERLVLLERRQQAGQAPGQHGLAGAGRAGEEQVVGAGGGDLQGPAGLVLAADVGEVLDRRDRGLRRRAGTVQVAPADQPLADLPERGGAGDPQVGDEGRLDQVGLGDDQQAGVRAAGGQGGRQHALDRADVAAQAELADGPQALERGRRPRPGCGQQPDGDGQVECEDKP